MALDLMLLQELRRGTLVLAVLSAVREQEFCGADLKSYLAGAGLAIEEGALYPMLRRLEDQGLLASVRRENSSRVKRFYSLSAAGHEAQQAMHSHWKALALSVDRLNGENHANG